MTDACIQCSTSSQDGNGAVDNSLGHSSNHFQFDSVATTEIVDRTAIAVASTTPDVVVIPTMDPITTPNAPTTLDSDSDAVVNLTTTPTSFTTLDVVAVTSIDLITTLNTLTALDVDADAADNPKATTSSFATEAAVVVSAMDPITPPSAFITPDTAAVSALDLTTTPSAPTTLHIAAATAVDLTATPISLPILDIAAVSALNLTTTRRTSTTPDIGVVSAMDLTTKSSTLTTLSVAAAAPVNGDFAVPSTSTSTGNRAMVALMEGSNVLIEYHKKKDVLRFINKPKEITRRLLLSIIGREQLKRLTLTEMKLNPLLFGILSAVESKF